MCIVLEKIVYIVIVFDFFGIVALWLTFTQYLFWGAATASCTLLGYLQCESSDSTSPFRNFPLLLTKKSISGFLSSAPHSGQ